MEDTDQDQKTEEPTSKRLGEARKEGNLAVSREMSSWFIFVGMLLILSWIGPMMAKDLRVALRVFLEKPEQISIEGGGLQNVMMGIVSASALGVVLAFGVLWAMSILGTMLQTDFYAGTGRMKFDLNKLSPMKGIGNLFSMNSISELVKSFFKLIVLGYLSYRILWPVIAKIPMLISIELPAVLTFLHEESVHLLLTLMMVITVIAVADILFVRWRYFKGLRMTKQEVKDEHKQTEGDPIVKSRLRQIRMDKARRRMMANVPNASVIITNPTHFAVALQYDGLKMAAPVLVAKGVDRVAFRIREVGEEHEIPIVSNPPLARALYDTVDLDQPITPEHYRAVAEVISYVYKMKNKLN